MSVEPIIEKRPLWQAGEKNGPDANYLMGLRIGPYVVNSDRYNDSLVARREGTPHGAWITVYKEDKNDTWGIRAYPVPAESLDFQWGSGSSNSNRVHENHIKPLPQFSPETVDSLDRMLYLGNPFRHLADSSVPELLEKRFDTEKDRFLRALDEVFSRVEI